MLILEKSFFAIKKIVSFPKFRKKEFKDHFEKFVFVQKIVLGLYLLKKKTFQGRGRNFEIKLKQAFLAQKSGYSHIS